RMVPEKCAGGAWRPPGGRPARPGAGLCAAAGGRCLARQCERTAQPDGARGAIPGGPAAASLAAPSRAGRADGAGRPDHGATGNVRELRNLMERVALYLAAQPLQALTPQFVQAVAPELAGLTMAPPVLPALPATLPTAPLPAEPLALTRGSARQALAQFGGNR